MKKDFLLFFVIILVIVFVAANVRIQSVEDYYRTHLEEVTQDSKTVFFSIVCADALDGADSPRGVVIPESGVILSVGEYVLRDGDTVFSVFDRVTRYYKIVTDYSEFQNGVYVRGINNLYEFSYGPQSGWKYSVNGVYPGKSAGVYSVADGDVIVWEFGTRI